MYKAQLLYIQDAVCPHVLTTQKHRRLQLLTTFQSAFSDELVQYNKQINTYTVHTGRSKAQHNGSSTINLLGCYCSFFFLFFHTGFYLR